MDGHKGTPSISLAHENSHCWLATFFDIVGDHLPDGTIHLPVAMTWHDVHAICEANHPPTTPLLTYSFIQLHLHAKSMAEAQAYHAHRAAHLNLAASEWLAYRRHSQLAKSCPSDYMSLIFDYSNPIPLPSHHPLPKSWMHFTHHYTMCLGGLIDHATGKHLFCHPQFAWPKDSNLIITTLFQHLNNHLSSYAPGSPQPHPLFAS